MVAPWLIAVIVSLAINVLAYVITPKPKQPKPDAVRDIEGPTASAGRPIPVVFGTNIIKSVNVLWYGDKSTESTQVSAA